MAGHAGGLQHRQGDLADRLLEALRAAEREGGDIRGTRSAALLVAPGAPAAKPWVRRFDLRIDLSVQPLEDLAQLLRTARAYEAFDAAMDANQAGDLEVALERIAVAHELAPDDAKIAFWHAIAMAWSGRPEEAGPCWRQRCGRSHGWRSSATAMRMPGTARSWRRPCERCRVRQGRSGARGRSGWSCYGSRQIFE